jgi:hypothetical protein
MARLNRRHNRARAGKLAPPWSQTQQHWHDDMSSRLNRSHWAPLVGESRAYLRALGECMELLAAAERETER